MSRERWGTFSVIDHKNAAALVPDVLLYDRLVLPVPTTDKNGFGGTRGVGLLMSSTKDWSNWAPWRSEQTGATQTANRLLPRGRSG
jgi:hypothetical protein